MRTEEEKAQAGYEAGQAAWQDCLERVMGHIPEDDGDAGPFIAGFMEATFMALIASHEAKAWDMVQVAFANAIEQAKVTGLEASAWREH